MKRSFSQNKKLGSFNGKRHSRLDYKHEDCVILRRVKNLMSLHENDPVVYVACSKPYSFALRLRDNE